MPASKKNKPAEPPKNHPLGASLDQNLQQLKSQLAESADISIRTFVNRSVRPIRMALIYVDGMTDSSTVSNDVLAPLMKPFFGLGQQGQEALKNAQQGVLPRLIAEEVLPLGNVEEAYNTERIMALMFNGSCIVLIDGETVALAADTPGGEKRKVEEPTSQTVIRGPKEGFTESLKTNLSLIRRRIKSPNLVTKISPIGRITQTEVAIVYIEGIAKDGIVQEVTKRLSDIDTDSILEGGYIEEYIQDSTFSLFPTLINTERSDTCVAGLLEGKVVIVVDGSPFVLLAPATFARYFQSSEDYYQRYDIASFLRIIRFISFFLSLLLPALYISITTFHQEMLPTPLLISLASQREGVPFPAFIEAVVMELTFEVLREAGVRMPRAIGPAISIVGALVLGQAAVQAGLVSAAMVIVVSFTAISNFVVPYMSMSIAARLIRFIMMLCAATFGLFGVMSGLMILLIHLCGLRSFGIPYLDPMSPLNLSDMKDVFVRFPRWAMFSRSSSMGKDGNHKRQKRGQRPAPPPKDDPEGGA